MTHALRQSDTADTGVALLHFDLTAPATELDAATAIYRETRRGRRVIAVASGGGQPEAALAAACDRIGLDVGGRRDGVATLVTEPVVIVHGAGGPARTPVTTSARPLRVALAGCGVVGGGLLERLARDPRFELAGVLVRDPAKPRDPAAEGALLVTDPAALLAREPDILIECLSDASTGLALIRAALARGIDVVSANKQAVGGDLPGLRQLAQAGGARLAFSASVGGGTTVLETLARARSHGPVVKIEAVLNGTVNFILNRLTAGDAFGTALATAQADGFAEADPSADLEGRDAAAKLRILAVEGFDAAVEPTVQTLAAMTVLPAGVVRQVARCERSADGSLKATVAFEAVDGDPLLAGLTDERNALRVTCADGRTFTCRGRGAGRWPTAESVWADVVDLVEG